MPKTYDLDAVDYIAKLADGHMRDALTMLDKCLAYSKDLTMDNVVKALGVSDYSTMMRLTDCLIENLESSVIEIIENIHSSGLDLKQFVRQYLTFILDVNKYMITNTLDYTQLPTTEDIISWLKGLSNNAYVFDKVQNILDVLVNLNTEIKWDTNPKYILEARLLQWCGGSR